MKFEHLPTSNDTQTMIRISGLSQPTLLLHVTDSHMNATDSVEGYGTLSQSYVDYNFDEVETRAHFEKALAFAAERQVDGVALTGDIVNGATVGNVAYLESRLGKLQAPILYTPGNHDWEFPGEPWGEETRQAHVGKFARLAGGDPSFRVLELNGILLIGIDNSTYQITQAQLDFYQAELERGLPVLLFMHIPIYVPSLLKDVLHMWGSPILLNAEDWDAERMVQWQVKPATEATRNFHRLLLDNPLGNLVGIFCGHVHFAHADALSRGSCQYVTKPGFQGGYRVIRLVPAD
ncbi:metallophosphoesterase family protein [Paenibacillus agaridevorans]|uniref:metallophosphoesterase family protein n=1 Tax=Paenibacillus agaridevorans TaxID=171404 RepID=UPI001BE49B8B|nr:metallophosphoesterase [Paenibacillus agaridevorans]